MAVVCCHCQFSACKTCVRHYLKQTTNDAHCMDCRKKWDLEFMKTNLNAAYVTGEYREHRANILTDRVVSQVEEYYDGALLIVESQRIHKDIRKLQNTIHNLESNIRTLRQEIRNKDRRISDIDNFLFRSVPLPFNEADADDETKARKKFIMPCQNANCRGMLSQAYKCGLCEKFTCSKCLEVKDDNNTHQCNPDSVATATEIKTSSKPCPKCGTRISKIDGCDQMWCVECKTAFSWSTGAIETGVVHNPHYFQWINRGGEAAPNCNDGINRHVTRRIVSIQSFIDTLSRHWIMDFTYNEQLDETFINNISQYVTHCQQEHLRPLRREIEHRQNNKYPVYKYFLGDISKDNLKSHLSKNDILNQRDSAFCDIYDALFMIVGQVFQDLLAAYEPIESLIEEFLSAAEKVNPKFKTENYRIVGRGYPTNALDALTSIPSFIQPRRIPECVNLTAKIRELYEATNAKYYNIFLKYTAYINAEFIKYLLLHGLKRIVYLWHCDTKSHKKTAFDSKNEYVEAEAYWRNIYNSINVEDA